MALKNLDSIDLHGNPVTTSPGYKDTFLTLLPNLKTLDGKVYNVC